MTEQGDILFDIRDGIGRVTFNRPQARNAFTFEMYERLAEVCQEANGNPRMLEGAVTAAGIGADLDAVFSVDTIRIYKPRREVYALVTDAFKLAPAKVAFVSSNRWDVMGATAFGFQCVWVNRANLPDEYPEFAPVQVVRDLASLTTLALP